MESIRASLLGSVLLNPELAPEIISLPDSYFPRKEEKATLKYLRSVSIEEISINGLRQHLDPSYAEEYLQYLTTNQTGRVQSQIELLKIEMYRKAALEEAHKLLNKLNGPEPMQAVARMNDRLRSVELKDPGLKTQIEVGKNLLNEIRSNKEQKVEYLGFDIGFKGIMRHTHGFIPGNVYAVAAESGVGKSGFINDIKNTFDQNAISYLDINLEMSGEALLARKLAGKIGVTPLQLRAGHISEDQLKVIEGYIYDLEDNDSLTLDTASFYIEELYSKIRKAKREGIQVVFIDYFQIIKSLDITLRDDKLANKVAGMIREVAKAEKVAVVVLCQMVKNIRDQDRHIPKISDVYHGTQLERDVSGFMLLWRPGKHNIQTNEEGKPYPKNYMEVHYNKNREGGRNFTCAFHLVQGKLLEIPRV